MSNKGIGRRALATLGLAVLIFSTNVYAAARRDDSESFFRRAVRAARAFIGSWGDTLGVPDGGK